MALQSDNKADFKAHEKSYSLFAAMMKWGTIISFIIAAFVVILIA